MTEAEIDTMSEGELKAMIEKLEAELQRLTGASGATEPRAADSLPALHNDLGKARAAFAARALGRGMN